MPIFMPIPLIGPAETQQHTSMRNQSTQIISTLHVVAVSMVTEMFASHLPAGCPCVAVRPARSCPSADPPDCTLLPDSLKDQEEILMKSNAHTRHKRDIAETIRADLSSGSQTHIELWHAHTHAHAHTHRSVTSVLMSVFNTPYKDCLLFLYLCSQYLKYSFYRKWTKFSVK